MANQFQIVIAAVDRATAVVGKVNSSFRQLTRPIVDVQSAVGRFGKEMGLDRVARDLGNVGRAAADVGSKVASIAAPLAAVAGVSSVAAVAALATEWARMGAGISRVTAGIGNTSDQLQVLRGAAKTAGVPTEALDSGLKSLGNTMQDALYGRNQDALVMMNRLGLRMKFTASGAVDTNAAFTDLAGAISKIKNPQVQNLVARTFGLEEALPLLRQGKEGLAQLEQQVRATGAVMSPAQVAQATRFQQSLMFASLSIEGLRNSIGDKLIPIIQPLVDKTAAWISANRDLIATRVGAFVEGIARAVEQIDWNAVVGGVQRFAQGVDGLVDRLGGWQNAAIAVVVLMNGGLIASVLNLGGALVRLGVGIIPVAVRALALLGQTAVVPLVSQGALRLGMFAEGLGKLAGGIPLVGSALTGVSRVVVGFAAALEATPIGWFIAGAAAVAGAAYLIYRNWGSIASFFAERWAGIKAAFDHNWSGGVVRALIEFNPALLMAKGVNALIDYLTGIDLFDVGAKLMQKLVDGVRSILPSLPKSVANAVRGIGHTAGKATDAVSSFLGYGPIGIRQNNPGNLRKWGDAAVKNGFAQFETPVQGISAMAGNLQAYGRHGWNTIDAIVDHWAPAKDKNNVPAYKAALVKQTGFALNAQLDLNDPKVLSAVIPAIIQHENGKNPYSAGLVAQGISARLGQPVAVASEGPAVSTPGVPQASAPAVSTPYSPAGAEQGGAAAAPAPAAGGAGGEGASGVGGGVLGTVVIEFTGAPPGTRVQAKSDGPIKIETRVGYAMQGAF